MKRKLRKAFVIPPELSRVSHPGQVPTSTRKEAAKAERAFKQPKAPTEADRLRDTSPRLTTRSVIEGLGLDKAQTENYRKFLDENLGSMNETRFRQAVLQKMLDDKLDPDKRRVLADRAVSYYRFRNETAKKSILDLDDLQKGDPRGGRYYRRIPTEKGMRYYYDEERYHKRDDAHLSGADVLRKRQEKAMADNKPGESLDETPTAELVATLQQLKDRHAKSPDSGTEGRIKAISAELSKRGMKDKPVEKAELSPAKAKEILRDGTVHGKPISDKQRGYFGAVAGGNAKKSETYKAETTEKACMEKSAIDELSEVGDELIKGGGEGSRGGKVVGHTASGKPIYQHHVDAVPGYAKDLADREKVKHVLNQFEDGDGSKDRIDNFTPAGARQSLSGLEGAIENKLKLAEKRVQKSEPAPEEPLEKAFLGGYSNWMDQFSDTPLHVKAMELTRDCLRLDREQDKFYRGKPQWDERQKLDVVARAKLEEQERQQFKAFDAKRREYEDAKRDLEEKLLSQRIEAAKLRKSQTICEIVVGEAERAAEEAPERAKRIKQVEEGTSADGGLDANDDDESLSKAQEDTMELDQWLQKSGALPEGEPGMDEGVEVSSPENGGKVAGVGKPDGSPQNTGNGTKADVGTVPSVASDKLSEDDAEVEQQMEPHTKPIEKLSKGFHESRFIPEAQNDLQARQIDARRSAQLRKGEADVFIPPTRVARTETMAKSEGGHFAVGRGTPQVLVDDTMDRMIEATVQGPDQFYPHGRPTIGALGDLRKSAECPACGLQKSLALSACPNCGDGTVRPDVGVIRGGVLVKSERPGPAMRRPARAEAQVLPNGIVVVDE